jgi:outer membrane biosynthesis protein TonB
VIALPARPRRRHRGSLLLPVPEVSPFALPATAPTVEDLQDGASLRPGSKPTISGSSGSGTAPPGGVELWTAESLDEPVQVVEQPSPRYPIVLERAGIAGRVVLEYVVDTLGRAEPGSLHAVASTRPEFEAAARASVLNSRYRPARLHGRVVRPLVRQVLSLRLE